MNEKEVIDVEGNEIYSKVLRAGRRTYFFDVRETRAGDYYLTITESKKFVNEDGSFNYKKHKIYLYKEDFQDFRNMFEEASQFILAEKGKEVISERHQTDWKEKQVMTSEQDGQDSASRFTDVTFVDIYVE